MPVALEPTPDHRDRLIVVGASVRKPLDILQPHIQSLLWQELPPRTRLHFCWVDDFTPQQADAKDYLRTVAAEHGGEVLRGLPGALGDFTDDHPLAHQWSLEAMRRVGQHKNKLLKRALELKADAVFLVDADVLLDRTVLTSLIACDKPIACAVYWTRWSRQTTETQKIWASPQVWLRHPYFLDGRGMDEATFRSKLVKRELTRVWGQGACSLISRRVLEAGIDFAPAPDFPQVGLNAGEDRQFCIKAERSHLDMWADPWGDSFHVYHRADDVPRIPEMLERLGQVHPPSPKLGDLVNVVLTALEPMPQRQPDGSIRWMQIAPQPVRGRLGTIAMLPELEAAILGLTRGQEVIVPVHVPIHYPDAYLRGRRRLIRIQLIDTKPLCYPPVLEDDLYMTPASAPIELTALTPQQAAAIVNGAAPAEERALELVP